MLDAAYAKLKAEAKRRSEESPSVITVSDVLDDLVETLPSLPPQLTPKHTPKKKKKRSKAQSPPALALSIA